MDAGAANFFRKPFEANAFVAAVQAALGSGRSSEAYSKAEETDALLAVRSVSSLKRTACEKNRRGAEGERDA